MNFEIKNRWSGSVLHECELSIEIASQSYGLQLGFAVRKAVSAGANLVGANLVGADLAGAYLAGADLAGAYLARANLVGAYLAGANLVGADLAGAYLAGANLVGADLAGAYLAGADLAGAYLARANLASFRQDVIAEVLRLPNELDALHTAIIQGRIDGSTYSGECACLAGTLAAAHGKDDYSGDDIDSGGVVFHADASSPRERWFAAIKRGDTPDTNPAARLALEWVDEAIAIRNMIRATAPEAQ